MNIRRIEPSDIGSIVSMIHEFAEYEGLTEYCAVNEERLHTAMFGEGGIVEGFVIFDNTVLAGYTLVYPGFSSFRGELGLNLEDLYVRGEYRGKGFGRLLLREIADTACQRGFVRIDFMVSENNPRAKAFYKKLGAVSNVDERHFKFAGEALFDLSQ